MLPRCEEAFKNNKLPVAQFKVHANGDPPVYGPFLRQPNPQIDNSEETTPRRAVSRGSFLFHNFLNALIINTHAALDTCAGKRASYILRSVPTPLKPTAGARINVKCRNTGAVHCKVV